MDPGRATSLIHRSWLFSEIPTKEKRRLWLGSVHHVATNAHAIKVGRPPEDLFVGICSMISSNISGGMITDAFGTDRSGPQDNLSSALPGGGELVAAHPYHRHGVYFVDGNVVGPRSKTIITSSLSQAANAQRLLVDSVVGRLNGPQIDRES